MEIEIELKRFLIDLLFKIGGYKFKRFYYNNKKIKNDYISKMNISKAIKQVLNKTPIKNNIDLEFFHFYELIKSSNTIIFDYESSYTFKNLEYEENFDAIIDDDPYDNPDYDPYDDDYDQDDDQDYSYSDDKHYSFNDSDNDSYDNLKDSPNDDAKFKYNSPEHPVDFIIIFKNNKLSSIKMKITMFSFNKTFKVWPNNDIPLSFEIYSYKI